MKTGDKDQVLRGIGILEQVLKSKPDDYDVYRVIGEYYFEIQEYQKAKQNLLTAQKLAEHYLDMRSQNNIRDNLGKIYIQEGRIDLADEYLTTDSHGNPLYSGCPYQAIGELYSKFGHRKKAVEYYKKGAEVHEDIPWSYYLAAMGYFNVDDFEEAEKHIDIALSLKEEKEYEPEKYNVLKGFLLLFKKNYKGAEQLFKDTLADDKQSKGAHIGLGHLGIIRKDYRSAEKNFAEAGISEVTFKDIYEKGRMGGIARWIDNKLIGRAPGWMRVHYNHYTYKRVARVAALVDFKMYNLGMGWLRANQNKHQEALVYFDRTLGYIEGDMLSLLGKGNSLIFLGRLSEAEEVYRKVLDNEPDNQFAIAQLGIVALHRGRYEQAEESFTRALKINDTTYSCPYEGLGLAYLKQGRLDEAKDNLTKAIEINPNVEYKKYNALADIYIEEGKIEKAEKLLQKSIENYPFDDEAKKKLEEIRSK